MVSVPEFGIPVTWVNLSLVQLKPLIGILVAERVIVGSVAPLQNGVAGTELITTEGLGSTVTWNVADVTQVPAVIVPVNVTI